MPRHEYDEPLRYEIHAPGRVIVDLKWFVVLCGLAVLGAITLLMIIVGV